VVSVFVFVSILVSVSVSVVGSDVVVSDVVVSDVVVVRVGDAAEVSEVGFDVGAGSVVLSEGSTERETDRLREGSSLGTVISPSHPTRPRVNAAHATTSRT
jgi:hypothetical protein